MKKKIVSVVISAMLIVGIVSGCENSAQNQEVATSSTQQTVQSTESSTQSENSKEAEELLKNLTGTYQELWPVLLSDEFHQDWVDDSTAIVGEGNATTAVEKLQSMVSATIYGEEAVDTYKDGNGMAYYCGFTQEVNEIQVDGSIIKGFDKNGNEIFSHKYQYIGMEETRGLYEYQSLDENSGEFTYFFFAPDTSDTTYHIEFRYGGDIEALSSYDTGKYAYWLASGISVEHDNTMVSNAINLFCTENLTEN